MQRKMETTVTRQDTATAATTSHVKVESVKRCSRISIFRGFVVLIVEMLKYVKAHLLAEAG